ncbi:MAG TPA: rhamnulokinase family protein, partial [Chthonomonadales bacterium]|nr:rhamnulokinase family protein [Chthonomonadales bacterium]
MSLPQGTVTAGFAKDDAFMRYLAFDLGAESGRAVMGTLEGNRLELQDVHRFPNRSVRVLDTLYWDALRLFAELKEGLTAAARRSGPEIQGIGIDTWGVDFGLLGSDGKLLANPRHYRDAANSGMMEEAFRIVPCEELFRRTGIQFMQFNTLFQLLALKRTRSPAIEKAETLLMMPDLLNYWLTGEKRTEFSIATTTQFYDPTMRQWAADLLSALDLPHEILPSVAPSGSLLGPLRPEVALEAGCGEIPVIAPAEHDTGSAVVAAPGSGSDFAYISSGTWSLMGIELPAPLITPETLSANFTNEGGADGTIRLLKNIMGLWLVQECRRCWAQKGRDLSYAELAEAAREAPAFGAVIEPDDARFLAPDNMLEAIRSFCLKTRQTPPQGYGATVRCCLESLALKYRWVLEKLERFKGSK